MMEAIIFVHMNGIVENPIEAIHEKNLYFTRNARLSNRSVAFRETLNDGLSIFTFFLFFHSAT